MNSSLRITIFSPNFEIKFVRFSWTVWFESRNLHFSKLSTFSTSFFQHIFNIFSTCFQHCFQRVGNTFQRVFNMRTWGGIRSISRIFPEICRWGAFENPQKSVNRPDPTFTHRFHGYSPKMRSGVWIRPISRFFRKFADGEPENLEKWEKWINNDPKII